jgi:hypothetical protein
VVLPRKYAEAFRLMGDYDGAWNMNNFETHHGWILRRPAEHVSDVSGWSIVEGLDMNTHIEAK